MSRLAQSIAAADGPAVSVYLAAGHPDLETSEANIRAALEGGADFVEIGIPFSDPAADGPTIEDASAHALKQGTTVDDVLALTARVRADYPSAGLVCMTYANIAYRRGWDRFARDLSSAGFDAAIIPDAPLEEAEPLRAALLRHGLAWVPLVTPTTSADRMRAIANTATGFLYVVANVGTTGQADPGPLVEQVVERARAAGSEVPLVVGFGLQNADDVARVHAAGAQGAIVGSALVQRIADGCSPEDVRSFVAGLRPRKS